MTTSDELPLYCPQCGQQITIKWGARLLSVREAIRLQLVRNGVFFECSSCGNEWVIRKVRDACSETTTFRQSAPAEQATTHSRGSSGDNT